MRSRSKRGRPFEPGNQAALKHGGETAIAAIRDGRPLTGLAATAQREVEHEMETRGVLESMRLTACRLEACSRLYWNAVAAALEAGDIASVDRYVARYGWLASSSMRAMAEYAKLQGKAEKRSLDELLCPDKDKDDGDRLQS